MRAQPLASLPILRAGACHQLPELRGVIEAAEVHQLVNQHVVGNPVWQRDKPPVQADVPVAPAGAPPSTLVSDTDPGDGHTQLLRSRQEPGGQLVASARPEFPFDLDWKRRTGSSRPLPGNPFPMPPRKGFGLAERASARNRDAHRTLGIHPENVSPRPAVTDEADRLGPRLVDNRRT